MALPTIIKAHGQVRLLGFLIVTLIVFCLMIEFTMAIEQDFESESGREERTSYYQMVADVLGQKQSYYDLLGVNRQDLDLDGGVQAVRRAFRKLAVQFHPDKQTIKDDATASQQQAALWSQLSFARDILIDAKLRQQYNRLLDEGVPLSDRYYGRYVHRMPIDSRIGLTVAVIASIVVDHYLRSKAFDYRVSRFIRTVDYQRIVAQSNQQEPIDFAKHRPGLSTLLPIRLFKGILSILLYGCSLIVSMVKCCVRRRKSDAELQKEQEEALQQKEENMKKQEKELRLQLGMTVKQFEKYKKYKIQEYKDKMAANHKKYARFVKRMN